MFKLTNRQREILITALSYAISNCDDINDAVGEEIQYLEAQGSPVPGPDEIQAEEYIAIYELFTKDEREVGLCVAYEDRPPRVIAYVEGGVVQEARASVPVDMSVWDKDNQEASDAEDLSEFVALEAEYDLLPEDIY